MKNDRDRMKCIISETIVALCNSGLDFSSELCVEGLLGITLDGRDILLVNINEVIKSGVSGTKTLPLRNVDAESERVFSEVTTSSDPTRMTAETHARISVTASSSCEQIASQPMPVQRQTEPFAVNSLTSVKSEPVGVIEDNKEEIHSIIDIRTIGDVSWTEHGIADAVQPAGSDMDESYVFAEQAAEEQCCKMDNSNTPEHFCDLTELSSDEAGSLAIMQQQTHPVCLYTNTARSQGASTSSASETRHSQMSPMSSQTCLQGLGGIAAAVADINNSHRTATSAEANELGRTFPTTMRNRWTAKRKRGRPCSTEFGFKIKCLDKLYDNLNLIRNEDLHKIGLGIPQSELVGGRRITTKLPLSCTVVQLRQKIWTLFPRLQSFTIMHGNQDRKLVTTVSTTLGDLKKEVARGSLYVVPDGPLKPLMSSW